MTDQRLAADSSGRVIIRDQHAILVVADPDVAASQAALEAAWIDASIIQCAVMSSASSAPGDRGIVPPSARQGRRWHRTIPALPVKLRTGVQESASGMSQKAANPSATGNRKTGPAIAIASLKTVAFVSPPTRETRAASSPGPFRCFAGKLCPAGECGGSPTRILHRVARTNRRKTECNHAAARSVGTGAATRTVTMSDS